MSKPSLRTPASRLRPEIDRTEKRDVRSERTLEPFARRILGDDHRWTSRAPHRRRDQAGSPRQPARALAPGGGSRRSVARRRTVQAADPRRLTGPCKYRHARFWPSTFDLMRDDLRSIGDRIRERRRELGLSQRDLSQPGISYAYISRIESGQRRPSLKVLRKLAPKLETTTHWLETGAPDPADELAALVLEYGRRPLPRRATHPGTQSARRKRARVARKSPPRNIFCPRRRPPGCHFGSGVRVAGRCGGCFGRERQDRRV